jgi:hypothetical protein
MDRMKDYRQLIKELPSTTLVCAFGDFDPPTTAHELMVKTVNRLSEQKNTDHVIYASTKDSLIQEEKKEQYLKLMFPKTKFQSVNESKINNLLEDLGKKYKKIVIVTGSEQVDKLKKLVKENTSIQIIPITEKNPDVNFAKMKQLAIKGLYEEFKKKLPSNIRELDGRRLMNDVRIGLGLEPVKENLILVKNKLREEYFRGEIFNEGDIVESNGDLFTIVKRGSNHLLLKEQSGNLVSKWIQDVKPTEEKEMKEAVIQPNGTDKLEPSTSDTGAKQDITKPTGKTKGFLTFYNYNMKESHLTDEDDTEKLNTYNPSEVGHTLVPGSAHHLRHMKVKYQTEDVDQVAKERMKAQLALKHAKEKETLAAKHTQEKENINELSTDMLARYKTGAAASAKAADASGDYAKGDKRFKGINKATNKQFDNDLKKHGQMKEELDEEHIVHVDDGSKYGEEPHDKDVEHVMSGAKTHGGEFDGHSDKGAFFKFKSHSDAKNFVDHVKRSPHKTVGADLHEEVIFEAIDKEHPIAKEYESLKKQDIKTLRGMISQQHKIVDTSEFKTKDHAASHILRNRHGNKKVSAVFGLSEEQFEEAYLQAADKVIGKDGKKHAARLIKIGSDAPTNTRHKGYDAFSMEEVELSEEDIDVIVDEFQTWEDVIDAYEDDELAIIDEETGEEIDTVVSEGVLNEVLSRIERIRAATRFARTKSKRMIKTKMALKRSSPQSVINTRARKLAIQTIKLRLAKKPLNTLSVAEKERLEQRIAKMKPVLNRIAMKLAPRVRQIEKQRLSHSKYTK